MEKDRTLIFEKIKHLSSVEPMEGESFEKTLIRALEQMETRCKGFSEHEVELERRTKEILDVLIGYAQLQYDTKAAIDGNNQLLDGLAAGVNMLGEELKSSTVSSQEKDILLKEIHHRVKNNLQIISSLLNLQSDQIKDEFAKEKYRVSRDRIQSMALVHEKLYESDDLARIDFNEYVSSLARSLNNSYNPDLKRIALQVELDLNASERLFRIETAIPCGLILNELLSNAFKYAFPGDNSGTIKVVMRRNKRDGKLFYQMRVEDDGVGLPDELDVKNTESLGMQLVHMLSDQLGAGLTMNNGKGVCFELEFSEN
ncbi:MAG TPA: histidine kinase dimerization/phosphoacceptor domain -containing protein [Bacteroidia bacterium]|jgi:two-component sensor histidine kinase|nr:histidine kinase dimerization/phosphoacceptor domain -containing protein [Bacteroidia bacterium]